MHIMIWLVSSGRQSALPETRLCAEWNWWWFSEMFWWFWVNPSGCPKIPMILISPFLLSTHFLHTLHFHYPSLIRLSVITSSRVFIILLFLLAGLRATFSRPWPGGMRASGWSNQGGKETQTFCTLEPFCCSPRLSRPLFFLSTVGLGTARSHWRQHAGGSRVWRQPWGPYGEQKCIH